MFNSVCNELKIPLRSAHLVWVYKWHIIDLFFFFFKRTSCSTFPTSHLFTSSSLSLQGMPQRVNLSYRVFLETVLSVLWPLWKPDHTVYNRQMNDKKTLHSSLLIKSFHLHFYDVGFPSDQMFSKHTNCYLSVFLMKVMSTLY